MTKSLILHGELKLQACQTNGFMKWLTTLEILKEQEMSPGWQVKMLCPSVLAFGYISQIYWILSQDLLSINENISFFQSILDHID